MSEAPQLKTKTLVAINIDDIPEDIYNYDLGLFTPSFQKDIQTDIEVAENGRDPLDREEMEASYRLLKFMKDNGIDVIVSDVEVD